MLHPQTLQYDMEAKIFPEDEQDSGKSSWDSGSRSLTRVSSTHSDEELDEIESLSVTQAPTALARTCRRWRKLFHKRRPRPGDSVSYELTDTCCELCRILHQAASKILASRGDHCKRLKLEFLPDSIVVRSASLDWENGVKFFSLDGMKTPCSWCLPT